MSIDLTGTFDFGGLTGGIIGTLGALLVAYLTVRWQNRKDKPIMHKKKYQLLLQAQSVLRQGKPELDKMRREGATLPKIMVKILEHAYQIDELLPDAIEVDIKLHGVLEMISFDLFGLTLRFDNLDNRTLDGSKDSGTMEGLIQEYADVATAHFAICSKLVRDIKKQAIISQQ